MSVFVPSCVEDFSRKWLLYVMQQYYANNYHGATISEIGEFRARRLCHEYNRKNNTKGTKRTLENHKDENKGEMEEREATTHESQHILSQAYKVMVDVPDPPREELAEEEGKKVNSGWRRKIFANCQMHIVRANCNKQGTKNVPGDYYFLPRPSKSAKTNANSTF